MQVTTRVIKINKNNNNDDDDVHYDLNTFRVEGWCPDC